MGHNQCSTGAPPLPENSRFPQRVCLRKGCGLIFDVRSGDRHNVTVTRLYRDRDLWRESQHFGRDDLLLLAKALDQAHTWIMQHGTASEAA